MTMPDHQPFNLPIGERGDPDLVYTAGATEPWTVGLLQAYIRAAEPKVVIETGSFSGETTLALVEALSLVQGVHALFTVEQDEARYKHVSLLLNARPFSGVGVEAVHGDALAYLRGWPPESVDMIFLDDCHTALHVRLELLEARRILRPGGACFVHDVMSLFDLAPVLKEFGGICLQLRRWHPSGGLGVMVK
jgi:predicted O-methyltransferase YrrM